MNLSDFNLFWCKNWQPSFLVTPLLKLRFWFCQAPLFWKFGRRLNPRPPPQAERLEGVHTVFPKVFQICSWSLYWPRSPPGSYQLFWFKKPVFFVLCSITGKGFMKVWILHNFLQDITIRCERLLRTSFLIALRLESTYCKVFSMIWLFHIIFLKLIKFQEAVIFHEIFHKDL